jgi:hypothetical protein
LFSLFSGGLVRQPRADLPQIAEQVDEQVMNPQRVNRVGDDAIDDIAVVVPGLLTRGRSGLIVIIGPALDD